MSILVPTKYNVTTATNHENITIKIIIANIIVIIMSQIVVLKLCVNQCK